MEATFLSPPHRVPVRSSLSLCYFANHRLRGDDPPLGAGGRTPPSGLFPFREVRKKPFSPMEPERTCPFSLFFFVVLAVGRQLHSVERDLCDFPSLSVVEQPAIGATFSFYLSRFFV